jgi:hypothetical protein
MPYVLDTNVFLQAKNLHYGFDFCPGFWDWLKESNQKGTVFSIEKVKAELVDDDAADWANQYGDEFFLKPDTGVRSRPFYAAEYLPSEAEVAAYIEAIIEDGDAGAVPIALRTVAEALGGMARRADRFLCDMLRDGAGHNARGLLMGPKAKLREQPSSRKSRGQFGSWSVSASLAACGSKGLPSTS